MSQNLKMKQITNKKKRDSNDTFDNEDIGYIRDHYKIDSNWIKMTTLMIKELPFEEATDKVGNEQESATIFQYDGH